MGRGDRPPAPAVPIGYAPRVDRRFHRRTRPLPSWVPRATRARIALAVGAGLLTSFALDDVAPVVRVIASWNVFAVLWLAFVWAILWIADAEETRRRAASDDPGRAAVWLVVVLSSTLSLFAAAVGMRHARAFAPGRAALEVVLSLGAVVSAWCLTHTAWTLRYAHLYYRDDEEGVGGLHFPGDRPPDEVDFAYFAFTIGMTFQVSDVTVSSPQIRRAVLLHGAQSFAFNTTILALTLNLAYGFLS